MKRNFLVLLSERDFENNIKGFNSTSVYNHIPNGSFGIKKILMYEIQQIVEFKIESQKILIGCRKMQMKKYRSIGEFEGIYRTKEKKIVNRNRSHILVNSSKLSYHLTYTCTKKFFLEKTTINFNNIGETGFFAVFFFLKKCYKYWNRNDV